MRKLIISGLCVLSTILPGVAQETEEASFLRDAAEQMNEYAALCLRNGFPGRARETWFEIISEYDSDDPTARKNLGFSPVGRSWEPVAGFEPPDRDNPDTTVARLL